MEELKPDAVIVFGFDVVYNIVEFSGTDLDLLYSLMYNRMLKYKSEGKIIVFFLPKTERH